MKLMEMTKADFIAWGAAEAAARRADLDAVRAGKMDYAEATGRCVVRRADVRATPGHAARAIKAAQKAARNVLPSARGNNDEN